ncbi:hypothetical protein ACQVTS_30030 [Bacillus mycoides]|uniref:hypothetical protein n=1 Tax=Bacillus mycoides TaxID=1405 RepID=UPI003D657647
MKIWLDGKRIFEEETDYGSKYYVFPRDKMQKNVTLHSYVVKKGEFNQPCKWIYADDLPETERIISSVCKVFNTPKNIELKYNYQE